MSNTDNFSLACRYTLRNAEYRLCLEKNLDIHGDNNDTHKREALNLGVQELLLDSVRRVQITGENEVSSNGEETAENSCEEFDDEDLGGMAPEVQSYIRQLRSRLSSTRKVIAAQIWDLLL